MNKVRVFLLLLAGFFFAAVLPAQTTICLDFEELQAGTVYSLANGYEPGDLAFNEQNVAVSVNEFFLSNGNTAFNMTSVLNVPPNFPPPIASGRGLFPNNMNLVFDFSGVQGAMLGVGFAYQDAGGTENLSVNGGDMFILSSLTQLPTTVAPGVTAQVVPYPGLIPPVGGVFLTGPVETLTVGGQQLALDNFCYQIEEANADCLISELSATPLDCNPDNGYSVLVDFLHENGSGAGFEVVVNGQGYGTFSYDDLPVTIGTFPGDGSSTYELHVIDLANPDCSAATEFGPVECNSAPCHIYELGADVTDCVDGQFFAILYFQFENVGSEGFNVHGNGVNYGNFEYSGVPVTIGPLAGDGTTIYEFVVQDNQHPDCHDFTVLNPVDCGGGGVCDIFDLVVDTGDCNPDGGYNITINFQVENPGNDFFEVFYDGQNIGFFPISELPVTIENFQDNGEPVVHLNVCINDQPDCCQVAEFVSPCPAGGDCHILDLGADASDCVDGQFFVTLYFQYENVGGEGFNVHGNGVNYGNFEYANVPITIGPLDGDGTTLYEFVVQDNQHPDCHDFTVIGPVDCPDGGNVWPGDANSDNIANNLDLLNLGIAFGAIGPTRNNPSILWDGWPSQDWVETFPSGVNFKHADCDGTGSVDGGDIEAIELNYNETHGAPEPVDYSTGNEDDPPLFADLPDQELQAGDPIEVPILLGTEEQQVDNIYGIAFTLIFNPDLIDPSSVNVVWPNSWLGIPGVNAITVDKKFVEEGVIDVAITRIDSNPVSGFGEIMGFIGIIDDVLGKHEMTIEIEKVRAIRFNEGLVDLRYPQESVIISSLSEPGIQTEGITVFPNPASDNLNWILAGNKHTHYAAVIDVNGRTIQEQFETGARISIRALPAGMYWLKVRSGEEVYMTRFVKTGR